MESVLHCHGGHKIPLIGWFMTSLFLFCAFPPIHSRLWQENYEPIQKVNADELRKTSKQFTGNGSGPDYFRLLERDGSSLLVGARNLVYNISLLTLRENQRLEWFSSTQDIETCTIKGKSSEECQNYIRVLMKKPATEQMLICGTNAYNPKCRDYLFEDGQFKQVREFSGVGSSPFDPRHNSTALQVDDQLFAGTVSDFSGQIPSIFRSPKTLKTKDGTSFFNEPNFIGSLANGEYAYFFFRESAIEYTNCGKSIYGRVARVCKNDKGSARTKYIWTSFLKSRLNCSVPGEYPFYFDELQSVSGLVKGNYNGRQQDVVYAVFGTPENSLTGSAVCAFTFGDIERTFNGRFKEQKNPHNNWLPVAPDTVPEPRPGRCVNDSLTLPDDVLNFLSKHTLMDEAVPAMYGRPLLIHISLQTRFTTVAVAPQKPSVDGRVYDVLFIGTNDGRVIKAVNLDLDNRNGEEQLIIEDIEVLPGQPVTNLLVANDHVVVVFENEIHSLKLQRCYLASTCRECVRLRDPMCAWVNDKCMSMDENNGNLPWPKSGAGPIQNIKTGLHERCPADPSIPYSPTTNQAATVPLCRPCITQLQCPVCPNSAHSAHDQNRVAIHDPSKNNRQKPEDNEVPEYQTANTDLGNVYKEETLAIAVVMTLLPSLLVGFFIGYQVSRYRNSAFKESNLSETSDYSYGPHRPGQDPRPADYRSEPIYAPADYPSSKSINVVLNLQRNTLKNHATSTIEAKPNLPSKKVYL
ncbi:semaphorin-1A-like isoform X2 [Paramacrobiotus metropolitanus]|uniref:semaphorin-1A-like isoform X2 n=1 Tax=Paramacrobiotus metropolitanus TaxID=2943436 RepID=UPI0024464638|nr:semaphorin-1A-like isoform X2 [Paramacrobiotus metropolitanus]